MDIETCGEGGFNVGWMDADEWLEYTVNVTETGRYTLRIRTASDEADGGTFHVSFRNQKVTQTTTVPYTGGWQIYQWIEIPDIKLTAGQQVMRFIIESSYLNLNYIEFVQRINSVSDRVDRFPPGRRRIRGGVPLILRAEAADPDGTVKKVVFYRDNLSIAIDDQPPFETVWTPVLPGWYSIHAKATNDKGATSTSNTVRFQVLAVKLPDGPDFSPPTRILRIGFRRYRDRAIRRARSSVTRWTDRIPGRTRPPSSPPRPRRSASIPTARQAGRKHPR